MGYVYLLLALSLNALANILLATGARRGITLSGSIPEILSANAAAIAGLAFFAANVGLYFLALRSLPVSVAYPIMVGTGFLLVNGYGYFVFGEGISPLQILGYGAIVLGIVLVTAFAKA